MPSITDLVGLLCILAGPVVLVGLTGLAIYRDLKTLEIRAKYGPQATLENPTDPRHGFEVVVVQARPEPPFVFEMELIRGFEVKPITGTSPVAEKEADDHG
jgi:hypothetical protein